MIWGRNLQISNQLFGRLATMGHSLVIDPQKKLL